MRLRPEAFLPGRLVPQSLPQSPRYLEMRDLIAQWVDRRAVPRVGYWGRLICTTRSWNTRHLRSLSWTRIAPAAERSAAWLINSAAE